MKRPTTFTKMHGLGNDFVVIDNRDKHVDIKQVDFLSLSNRRLGIGFDQLLLIEPSTKADFFCRIYNADGSEAEQCGNGLRCIARYIHENKLSESRTFSLETVSGIFPVNIPNYDTIQIAMNVPMIQDQLAHVMVPWNDELIKTPYSIISTGNPHAIAFVDSVDSDQALMIARAIASLSYFPEGVNIGLMKILSGNHIVLRTFERGAGETPACGSNACAAVTAGIINQQLEDKVRVEYPFGSLFIEWQGKGQPILMTGPAATVFTGTL